MYPLSKSKILRTTLVKINVETRIMKRFYFLLVLLSLDYAGYSQTAHDYFHNGLMKVIGSDYKGAIVDYTKAIEINPNYSEAFNYRGHAKYYLQDYTGAITDYNTAIELNQKYAEAYRNRGWARIFLRENIEAIADFTKAIEIDPNDAETYYNRGDRKADLQIEDYRGAIVDYTKAIELNPKYEEAYNSRGWKI